MAVDVGEWLDRLGLTRYAQLFAENEIDLEALPHITDEDLKEIGVALGARRKILAAVAAPKGSPGAPRDARAEPAEISSPKVDAEPAAGGVEAERRQLTVMFVDLVGSTELTARLDPEEVRDLISAYQRAVSEIVTRFDGLVAKFMGDGVLCYFGWPRAHEDDAERAVYAALAIMQAVKSLRDSEGGEVSARAGIATGLVVVGDLIGKGASQEEAVVGETPNLAARLQGVAAPGQVILPEGTRRLLGDLFTLSDLGEKQLKGIAAPVRAFAVEGERLVETRFAAHSGDAVSSMFGRDHELALLFDRWNLACDGEGQMVLLTGEAGIGKSRIARALHDAVEGGEHLRISYQCSPYHSDSALQPTIRQLSLAAGLEASDTPDEKLDKLERLLRLGQEDISVSAPLLAALLGFGEAADQRYGKLDFTPAQRRSRTLETLLGQLLGLAERAPLLFTLEDAHWIDPTTLELLDLCLEHIGDARVLILVTARPSFVHDFRGQSIVTRLTLNRLGRQQIAGIVARITNNKPLPPEVMEEIAARTDGVPLFVEEFTKTLLELGVVKEMKEAYVLEGQFDRLIIPSSLHDSLMARLDRLQPVKEVAQSAACIGRDFSYGLLSAILPLDDDALTDALDKLVSAELVFKRGVPPDASYSFKHALVQDAAYESLLKSRRQAIHAKLAEVLEDDESAPPELVAHHATEAGLNERAVELWREAGTAAMAQPAYVEAASHLRSALEVLSRLQDREAWRETELEILIQLAQNQMVGEGYLSLAATQSFAKAKSIIDATDKMDLRAAVYYGTWIGPYLRAQHDASLELTETFLREAREQDALIPKLIAHRMRAATLIAMGRSGEALPLLEQAFDFYLGADHGNFANLFAQEPGVQIRCYRYLALWMMGYPDQAAALADEATAISRDLGHTNTICYNNFHDSVLGLWSGDLARLKDSNEETLRLATEHGMLLWRLYGDLNDSLLRSRMGEPAAIDGLEEAFAHYREAGCQLWLTFYKAEEAKELLRLGRLEDAKRSIRTALDFAKTSSEHWADAELYRVNGEVQFAENLLQDAESSFLRALETAREQRAKSLELRAATSVARLYQSGGERDKALELLEPVHGWFSEGFSTADYQEASALISQLKEEVRA